MTNVKFSGLPVDSAPLTTDIVPMVDLVAGTTKKVTWGTLLNMFFNQVNIPAGSGSPVTRADELTADFVYTGGVWTGDAYASTKNASMTAGTVYINGRRLLISAVSARTFTASKDTYVDILDNADGTGTVVYTEVANGAASPALAANSIRMAKIVTGVSNIAAATSITQFLDDSLGNAIYRKNPTGPHIRRQPTWLQADNSGGALIDMVEGPTVAFSGTPTGYARGGIFVPKDYGGGDVRLVVEVRATNTATPSTVYYAGARDGNGGSWTSWNLQSSVSGSVALTANVMKEHIFYTIPAASIGVGYNIAFAWRISAAITGSIYVVNSWIEYTTGRP